MNLQSVEGWGWGLNKTDNCTGFSTDAGNSKFLKAKTVMRYLPALKICAAVKFNAGNVGETIALPPLKVTNR